LSTQTTSFGPEGKRRSASELGLCQAAVEPGSVNAITDVTGVRVGHTTLIDGAAIRTGVTTIVPDAVDRAGGELAAGLYVGNGFGKLIGATQLVELGVIETPIVLTGTLSAFRAADALVGYMLSLPGNESMRTVNPVVGETNDGYLSDIRARPITQEHVLGAITGACTGPVAQGCVGAGTGTGALGFKAGIGTASRQLTLPDGEPGTLGVLVQSNFSGTLTVQGVRIEPGQALAQPDPDTGDVGGNSCMIVVAIDRALDSRQLTRVARRAVFAMADVGSEFSPYSGDYAIAFATAEHAPVPESALARIFAAVAEATAEAILNSLFLATTTTGHQAHTRQAVPLDYVCRVTGRVRSTGHRAGGGELL
jgi:D-aminopeptidase